MAKGSRYKENLDGKRRRGGVIAVVLIFLAGAVIFMSFDQTMGLSAYQVKHENIPEAFDGFTIILIADYHSNISEDNERRLLDMIDKSQPDIIVIAGDMVDDTDGRAQALARLEPLVIKLVARAPVYAVSGNHDRWSNPAVYRDMLDMYRKHGVHVLEGATEEIRRGGQRISISGLPDPDIWSDHSGAAEYYDKEIGRIDLSAAYNILLFHRANLFPYIKGRGIHLVLAGHIHGGQVRLPFVGGLMGPRRELFPKYDAGRFEEEDTTMIVSRGMADAGIGVPRIFNSPELVKIVLECK